MRKTLLCIMILTLGASIAFAANFSPTLLRLSAASAIHYDFDGSALGIPVNVKGVAGTGVLFVYTKDMGSSIDQVQNGHLGWHFVNQIDTCIWVSPSKELGIGNNIMEWDGKDADGGVVPAGDYNYIVWAFDSVNAKVPVSRVQYLNGWVAPDIILTKDENGNPLANPVIVQSGTNCCDDNEEAHEAVHSKWVIGGDPDDASLKETTSVMTWRDNSRVEVLPTDHSMWFKAQEKPNGVLYVCKYKWVPNGPSELQTDWGEDGWFEWTLPAKYVEFHFSLAIAEGGSDLLFTNMNHQTSEPISDLVYLDLEDGSYVDKVDLSDWWINVDEGELGGFVSGGPTDIYPDKDGNLSLNMHGTCLVHVMDPYRDGDVNEKTLYVNANGDSFLDTNYEEDAERPWVCNDPWVGVYKYGLDIDANGTSMISTYGIGAVSFGLTGPDGTGAGYYSFLGETTAWGKGSLMIVDYGSSFDGIYTENTSAPEDNAGWWFVGHDSIKGVITSAVAVEDEAPAAFAVAQNSPNPFNPATTISFTIPEASNVSIDVYNVAGQKVDTIASEFMNAGSHSVTWDASGLSAGVYFYTVNSGEFSRTMKMTLLK